MLDTSPGSPTARCVRCAGSLLDGLHLWFVHAWCYSLVPMGMGCWLGAALRRLPLLRLSEISSNDFDWMLRMGSNRAYYVCSPSALNFHPSPRRNVTRSAFGLQGGGAQASGGVAHFVGCNIYDSALFAGSASSSQPAATTMCIMIARCSISNKTRHAMRVPRGNVHGGKIRRAAFLWGDERGEGSHHLSRRHLFHHLPRWRIQRAPEIHRCARPRP